MTHESIRRFCRQCGQPVEAGETCTHCHTGPTERHAAAVEPVAPETGATEYPAPLLGRRQRLFQLLVDPRTIQRLLICGAVLLTGGMVVWLASLGVFDDPMVVAASLGFGTLALMGSGWWVTTRTSLGLAGRSVTLLACLVMPLNLWFYHSHHLMTLDGHLWIAAAVCTAIYAVSALVVRDSLFVYVLMGGVAMTGGLILIDAHHFAEIASPSLMLLIIGMIGIHVEMLFPNNSGPFSREKFGAAFFRAGHLTMAAGLLLLAGAQMYGLVLHGNTPLPNWAVSKVVTDPTLKLVALGIVAAAAYGYAFSAANAKRRGEFTFPMLTTLLWAEALALQFVTFTHRAEMILAIISLSGLAIILLSRFVQPLREPGTRTGNGVMMLAFIGSTMLIISRSLLAPAQMTSLYLAVALGVFSLLASLINSSSDWKYGHLRMAMGNALLAAAVIIRTSHLTFWDHVEIGSIVFGLVMLGFGHVGVLTEKQNRRGDASMNLALGSLFAGLPVLIATIAHRFGGEISMVNEIGLLSIGSLLLVSGLIFELRSTTITGGSLLSLHMAILFTYAGLQAQLALGAYLSIGGAVIFLAGLGLAMYRDRLIELPGRIHRREGVFKILAWR